MTLDDVVNSSAVEVGSMLARLLNQGFPIRTSLNLASEDSVVGSDYLVVGDGGHPIAQVQAAFPNSIEVERTAEDQFEVLYRTYPAAEFGMGSLVQPFLPGDKLYYLSSGIADTFTLTEMELQEFLSLETIPIVVGDSLHWSDEFSLDSV
nr:hypothetical protein [Halogeometricum sp. CBA1124]